MLINMGDLEKYAIEASDGKIGHIIDFYFDDDTWCLRYFVVDTGSWLFSRKVLIPPVAIEHLNSEEQTLSVSLTREQVKNSPDIDTDKPISRQREQEHLAHYGYGAAASGALLMSGYAPIAPPPAAGHEEPDTFRDIEDIKHRDDDHHLRSCKAVKGYNIEAVGGDIGHVKDMLIDEETWAVRYFIVNTSNWWLGHSVLIAPQWINSISWGNEKVGVDLDRKVIKEAPPYDATTRLNRAQELAIYKHYGRSAYWENTGDN